MGNVGLIYMKGDKVKTHIDHIYDVGGAFFKKDTNLTKDEINKIGKSLDSGQMAVVVTCTADDVQVVSTELTKAGGTVKDYAAKDGDKSAASVSTDSAASSTSGSGKSSDSSGSSS